MRFEFKPSFERSLKALPPPEKEDVKARILFRWQGGLVEFVLAGNHDDVKRFLRNV